MVFRVPEMYRVTSGPLATSATDGNNGAFIVRHHSQTFQVIASNGGGWDHVSVSRRDRCPTWTEMDYIKRMFWGPDDVVIQIHPADKDYINNHEYCLHLWRPQFEDIPIPPVSYV